MKITIDELKSIIEEEIDILCLEILSEGEVIEEAEYRGRKVKLNKPTRGDVKKFKVLSGKHGIGLAKCGDLGYKKFSR